MNTQIKTLWTNILLTFALVLALCVILPSRVQGAEYDCGTYGAGNYDNAEVCGAATTEENDDLSNTGQALAIVIPAGLILAGTVLLYRLSHKKSKHTASNE